MMARKVLFLAVTIVVLATTTFAQQFEVTSVRTNKADDSGVQGRRISIQATPGNLTMRNVTLMSAVRWAYNVHDFQIQGGPAWRDSDRYDIAAKPASAATEDQLRVLPPAFPAG